MAAATSNTRHQNGATAANHGGGEGAKKSKSHTTGQKLMIRQLPPLITEEEIANILGEEWKLGNGKVDWAQFQHGKVSKSSFKEPRPSLYSLHVAKDEDVAIFRDFVLRATWHDAKNSYNMLNFPVHAQNVSTRVPPTKHRVDPRQGTIDQDPEFQAFLHSLTQPRDTPVREVDSGDQVSPTNEESSREGKVSHLVKYIQEKKAAKAKDAAAAKSAKHSRQESQSGKAKGGDDSKKKGKETKADRGDKEKERSKEQTPKLLTKKASQSAATDAVAVQATGQASTAKATEEAIPKSRRANIAQAAKILQRDLGLSPGSAHRRARLNAAKTDTSEAEPAASTATEKEAPHVKEPEAPKTTPTGPKAAGNDSSRKTRGKGKGAATTQAATETSKGKSADAVSKPTTGPIILLKKDVGKKDEGASSTPSSSNPVSATPAPASTLNAAAAAAPAPKASSGKGATSKSNASQQKKASAQPGAGGMRAFVKHANLSQGITEPLLKQAMESFGHVTFVEIDKRKGFAYVDFEDAESLRKAIAASPVAIAQGTVQVLERKDKKPTAIAATATNTTSPATAQPATVDKTVSDPQPSAAAAAGASSDRPKRGNRGRGRRGGGAGNAATAGNSTTNDGTSATGTAASQKS